MAAARTRKYGPEPQHPQKNNLRAVRLNRGYTQGELAEKVGLKNAHSIANYENGRVKEPNIVTVRKMAKVLGVRIDYLFPQFKLPPDVVA